MTTTNTEGEVMSAYRGEELRGSEYHAAWESLEDERNVR